MGGNNSKVNNNYQMRRIDDVGYSPRSTGDGTPTTLSKSKSEINVSRSKSSVVPTNGSKGSDTDSESSGTKSPSGVIGRAPSATGLVKTPSSATIPLGKSPSSSTLSKAPSGIRSRSGSSASLNRNPSTKVGLVEDNGTPTRSDMSKSKSGIPISRANSFGASFEGSQGVQVSPKASWLVKDVKFCSRTAGNALELKNPVLGVGLMGTVRLAELTDNRGMYVAVKSIRKDYVIRHNDFRHVESEKSVLTEMNSPFCIKLFGTYQDDENIFFIMEYAAGGELFRRLTRRSSFSVPMTKFYSSEIFLALHHVQSLGYVFRDLKPENVMLDEYGHCKLIDFGFCIKPGSNGMCTTNVGTPAYLSPEQLNMKFTGGYTKIVDWWSFGVLLFELLTGLTPFCKHNRESPYEIYLRVLKGKISFPRGFDSDAKNLVQALLHAEMPSRLVNPDLIRNHTFFADVDWQGIQERKIIPPYIPKLSEAGDRSHFDNLGDYREHKTNLKGKDPASYEDQFMLF